MYSTIKFGTASKATPQGRLLYRAGVGFELAIKLSQARRLDHSATTSLHLHASIYPYFFIPLNTVYGKSGFFQVLTWYEVVCHGTSLYQNTNFPTI